MVFTNQAGQLGASLEMGDWREALAHVISIIADCDQTLEHRGRVTLKGDTTIFGVGDTIVENITINGGLRWAKADTAWVNASLNNCFVDARKCEDRTGLNPTDPIRVFLPRNGKGMDPNVIAGDVFAYTLDNIGDPIADVLDQKIGSVKLWALPIANAPQGWVLMDGVANDTAIDCTDHFVKGLISGTPNNTAYGSAGGSHDHGGDTGAGTAHTHTINSNTTSLTVGNHANHEDHTHTIAHTSLLFDDNADGTTSFAYVPAGDPDCSSTVRLDTDCSMNPNLNVLAHDAHVETDPGHIHTAVNESTHTHPITEDATAEPLHKKLYWIERIDNSLV